MKQVIVINPERLNGNLVALSTATEPQRGEYVELITELRGDVIGTGNVVNPRPDHNWPGRWLYDVRVSAG